MRFCSFTESHLISTKLPLEVSTVASFIAYLHSLSRHHATIRTILSALSFFHKSQNLSDPVSNFIMSKIIQGTKRLSHTPTRSVLKPISLNLLERMVEVLPLSVKKSYSVILLQALFLLTYYACLRAGKVVHSTVSDHVVNLHSVKYLSSSTISMTFNSYKHSSAVTYLLSSLSPPRACSVQALTNYLKVRERSPGPLFVSAKNSVIKRQHFSKHIKHCIQLLSLSSSHYNTHSFRIGRATDLAFRGVPDQVIKATGLWKSSAYRRYIRVAFFEIP